jgi:hypothetical protein
MFLMDWLLALGQAFATVAGAVLVYLLGQLLVKLAEPALALRALIGRIAGDFIMYANRDKRIAPNEERLKIFRRYASDLFEFSATIVCYPLFSSFHILPPKGDLERAAKLLIGFSNAQLADEGKTVEYLPWRTQQDIRRLLKINDPDTPGKLPAGEHPGVRP